MKPVFVTHESYQNFVLSRLKKHYSDGILTLVSSDWPIITKLWITDISYITSWLNDTYSAKGNSKCNCPRLFSQPDCNSGCDSSRENYYNGYSLYMLSACDSINDLPLYPRLHPASRHASVIFVTASIEFSQRFTLGTVNKFLLDAAHDAEGIYELLNYQKIEAFIDLNPRTKTNFSSESNIKISLAGIPICPIGEEMKPNGYDKSQNRSYF